MLPNPLPICCRKYLHVFYYHAGHIQNINSAVVMINWVGRLDLINILFVYAAIVIALSTTEYDVSESEGFANVTINWFGATARDIVVNFYTVDATAVCELSERKFVTYGRISLREGFGHRGSWHPKKLKLGPLSLSSFPPPPPLPNLSLPIFLSM